MTPFRPVLAAAFLVVAALPAAADCASDLALMDEVLDQASRASIASSTGGQGVAGAREARAMTGTEAPGEDTAEADGDPQDTDPEQAPGHAPPAESGDSVQQLRAAVAEARTLAGSDEAACRDTLVEALRAVLSGDEIPPAS